MSTREPKIEPRVTVRKLRGELCALQAELARCHRQAETQNDQVEALAEEVARLRDLLTAAADYATHGVLERDRARRVLRDVWATATEGDTAFFQRLAKLQRFGREVGEELAALEKGEEDAQDVG